MKNLLVITIQVAIIVLLISFLIGIIVAFVKDINSHHKLILEASEWECIKAKKACSLIMCKEECLTYTRVDNGILKYE